MSVDTPAPQESSGPLSVNQAASLFANPAPEAKPEEPKVQQPEAKEATPPPEANQAEAQPDKVEAQAEAKDEIVTIEVDGKPVELKRSELADYYKNGLRQADYTRKTMETAEQRKAAEAEVQKAREERGKYAQGLQQANALLQAQLHEQSQIDWQKLLETDPVEYLKQRHLVDTRQAQLNHVVQQQQQLAAQWQAEQAQATQSFLQKQQQELLAKLPEWKDGSKAKADAEAIKSYLQEQGFSGSEINAIADHRAVVMTRKAMLYDQMMAKARDAAQKVQNLPQKVERPGVAETSGIDGRTAAMKRLSQTGSVNDAANAFAALRQRS